ncbi:hypothetical protein NQ314_003984 [Rhamnusium bicolor]|uniref:Uncharacterized protein n=1 Tax=Rhamnusium bicolor TaxID=1586634 RepID=A0AAV8ZMI7_9CUCU|nr:hypothetical protein NQ314_003984 [Rhamnusium bicolor]
MFVFLDIVGRNMLEVIIPHLNLYISSDPKICHTCNKNMLTCYEFKSICDREFIKTDVKIEDIKVFQTKLEQKCNFCLSSIDDNEIDTSGQFYKEDLQQYLPKWINPFKPKKGEKL